jgi:hypothetical protein
MQHWRRPSVLCRRLHRQQQQLLLLLLLVLAQGFGSAVGMAVLWR